MALTLLLLTVPPLLAVALSHRGARATVRRRHSRAGGRHAVRNAGSRTPA